MRSRGPTYSSARSQYCPNLEGPLTLSSPTQTRLEPGMERYSGLSELQNDN